MTTTETALEALLAKYEIPNPPCFSDLPDGWVGIVDELISDLIELGWNKDLQQVKEKFGGLRFYIGGGEYDDDVWQAIQDRTEEASVESTYTCEVCGEEGERKTIGGYIQTLCTDHRLDLEGDH